MALSVSQIVAASYPAIVAEKRKPTNQWAENAALREFERQKILKVIGGAPTIEAPLDYQKNPDAGFFTNDFDPYGMGKTDVITDAVYSPAPLRSPIKWSKADEAKNSSENQKFELATSLIDNGLNTHDDLIEKAIFGATTQLFTGLLTLCPTSGQGTVGGIDSSVEAWWRNYAATYLANFSDLKAQMTSAFLTASKGTGSDASPTLIAGSIPFFAGFYGTLTSQERYMDAEEAKVGFKVLSFMGARVIASQYAPTTNDNAWFLSPKNFQLRVFKNAWRQKGDVNEITGQSGYVCEIFSMLQAIVLNKSRLAVITHP